MTTGSVYLRLCDIADTRNLQLGLAVANNDGLLVLSAVDTKSGHVHWAPTFLEDLDVAAGFVLDDIAAPKRDAA